MSTVDPRVRQRAQQLALSTFPQHANITVDIDAQNNIVYTDKVTGNTSVNDLDLLINGRNGLVDYRFFDPGTGRGAFASIGSNAGALQLESEVMVVNEFLRAAQIDPAKAQRLRDLGLGHMIGEEVTGEFLKFNTRGQTSIVKSVRMLAAKKGAVSKSITDEGYSFLTLKGKNRDITAQQGRFLRIVSGAEQVQPAFLAKLIGGIDPITGVESQNWSNIGKLAKRIQSTMSPRDVTLGEEFIRKFLDTTHTLRSATTILGTTVPVPFQDRQLFIDSVATRFELMFRDPAIPSQMTEAEKLFALAGVGGDPVGMTKSERKLLVSSPAYQNARRRVENQKFLQRRQEELNSLTTVHNFEDWEVDMVQEIFNEADAKLMDPSHIVHTDAKYSGMTRVQKQFELMKQEVDDLERTFPDEQFPKKMKITFEGMEKARDGQSIMSETFARTVYKAVEQEIQTKTAYYNRRGTTMTLDEVQEMNGLRNYYDSMDKVLKKIKKNEDVITRVNTGYGQLKGETMVMSDAMARRFEDPITKLVPHFISDVTNLKEEVGSHLARNIGMDISGEVSSKVFSDPLMALYHEEYFTQPAMIESMRVNVKDALRKTQEFMESGEVPEDVMKSLKKDLENKLKTHNKNIESIEDFMLDPQTRMSHLRKKREAEEILTQMATGIRANEIPAMVRRVTDYHAAQAVRFSNGSTDIVMPTANRFSLRTFDSRQVSAEGFRKSTQTAVHLGHYGLGSAGSDILKTEGFRVKQHALMISGDAAYLYQHSLGGFDLDDKGIPFMSTFKGVNATTGLAEDRLAFLVLRQPTSFQESIAMTADLSDADTVRSLFENNKKFQSALKDDTILAALGIRKTDKNYKDLQQMVNGKSSQDKKIKNVDSRGIEDLILKISNSDHVYPEGLPQLANSQIVQMVLAQSPSVLGLDKMVQDRTGKLSPWGEYVTSLGINPNKTPVGYDSDAIFQVLRRPLEQDQNTRLLAEASSVLGYTVRDAEHIGEILRGGGAGYRPGDDVRLTERMTRLAEDIMESSANSDVAESIGVFTNRQAASVNVLEASRKILLEETALGVSPTSVAYDKFLGRSSIMTLPASEAVDVAKQIGAEQVLHNFGDAIRMADVAGVSQSSIEEALKAYVETLRHPDFSPLAEGIDLTDTAVVDAMQIPSKLSAFGEQSLRSFSSVGYVRGKQIAEQITRTGSVNVGELYGLQQTMFEGEFARIKSPSDTATISRHIIDGLNAAMGEELSPGVALSPAQLEAMKLHRDQLASQDTKAGIESMYMQVGTEAYNRYASVDRMNRAIMDIRSAVDSFNDQYVSGARRNARRLDPVAKAAHQNATENIIGTVSAELTSLQLKVTQLMKGNAGSDLDVKALRTVTLSKVHEGLSAAIQAAGVDVTTPTGRLLGADTALDIMETLSANMQAKIGREGKEVLMSSTILADGSDASIETMHAMHQAMTTRIAANSSLKRADKLAVLGAQDAYRSGIGDLRAGAEQLMMDNLTASSGPSAKMALRPIPISTELADMTRDEAAAFVDASRNIRKGRGVPKRALTDQENTIVQFAGRLMRHAKGDIPEGLRPNETPEAHAAFMYYISGREQLIKAQEKAAEAMKGFLSGSDIPTVARDAVARSRSTARTAFSAGTAYKRIGESFRTGALGDALKNKGVRTGLAAAAALSVFGFVKSNRRDHSSDDISGPPLLPGGSAYESGYPARQAVIESLRTLNPVTRGMQYKVYASGSSEDAEKLRSMVDGVTDGEVNSTMYSSLPLLGQDPYSQVASQF